MSLNAPVAKKVDFKFEVLRKMGIRNENVILLSCTRKIKKSGLISFLHSTNSKKLKIFDLSVKLRNENYKLD